MNMEVNIKNMIVGYMAMLAVCSSLRADQNGMVINTSPEVAIDVAITELGHQCYSNRINLLSSWGWHTDSGAPCLVNADRIIVSVSGNPGINCTAELNGVYQRDKNTHRDIWNSAAITVGTAGIELCIDVDTATVGNHSAVTSNATCSSCPAQKSHAAAFQPGNFRNIAAQTINLALYMGASNCYSTSVSANGGFWNGMLNGPGHGCSAPLSSIVLTAELASSCNVTFSNVNITNGIAAIIGVMDGGICITQASLPSGQNSLVHVSCPPCENL